jgi:hypothetical protein
MLGAHAGRAWLLINELHRILRSETERGRINSSYIDWIKPPRLVTRIDSTLNGLHRSWIAEVARGVGAKGTDPGDRVGDHHAIGFTNECHPLVRARAEAERAENVPLTTPGFLVHRNRRDPSSAGNLVNRSRRSARTAAPARIHAILAATAVGRERPPGSRGAMPWRMEQVPAAVEPGRGGACLPGPAQLHRGVGIVHDQFVGNAGATTACMPATSASATSARTERARSAARF